MLKKKSFGIFKSIKHSRPFILKTHTKVEVPFAIVRNLLIQRDVGEKRANWVMTLQEHDIEIRLAKIVKGQGFFKMLGGASSLPALQDSGNNIQIYEVSLNDTKSRYADTIFYLRKGYAPPKLNYQRKRALSIKARQYQIINNVLFRINYEFFFS